MEIIRPDDELRPKKKGRDSWQYCINDFKLRAKVKFNKVSHFISHISDRYEVIHKDAVIEIVCDAGVFTATVPVREITQSKGTKYSPAISALYNISLARGSKAKREFCKADLKWDTDLDLGLLDICDGIVCDVLAKKGYERLFREIKFYDE